ncbi:alpha/beta hydrolase [Streptomyces sp. HC44]|uniref:Alpha/beta hydrolase n=1 Tax=Streptomyces scabichelini TaxID=2711217 RepID=A0A6G4VF84_9ACTN|nr:acetylxylan esterase [Streptomyces scabichelini]NGO12631.1 alpha/beta hydrolase [Streptomyces scabichelini]
MRHASTRTAKRLGLLSGAAALAVTGASLLPQQAEAGPGDFQRGPAPTEQSITAERGPFATAQTTVDGPTFNRGTAYYPTDTSQGTFGAVAISPGFASPEAVISWYGPRLASQGFVVLTLETNSVSDQPDSRATQLVNALDFLVQSSSVKNRIDPNRLAVMGHSMGGGGSLKASELRPSIKAAVPLMPWNNDKTWQGDRVPTMIMGAQNDAIASPASHAKPFYDSLTSAPEKAYLELRSQGHLVAVSPNTTIAKYSIAWLKRFVDEDTRYEQFLCPAPTPNLQISEYRNTCPTG